MKNTNNLKKLQVKSQKFKLVSSFKPKGDQPKAIEELCKRVINSKNKLHVLLGATGTGKTFTIANVIEKTQKRALILAPNKTLCGQLYQEMREFFPNNRVEYFVSHFDMYQPEAYNVKKGIYIDSSSLINKELKVMRMSTMQSLATRKDTIVVSSVASLFGQYDPNAYFETCLELKLKDKITMRQLIYKLVGIGYVRNDLSPIPGTFQVKGQSITIGPSYEIGKLINIEVILNIIDSITIVDDLNRYEIKKLNEIMIGPGQDYIMNRDVIKRCVNLVKEELKERVSYFKKIGKPLFAQRLEERTLLDMEDLEDKGICKGIENYSRHLEAREEGEPPFTLLDYFEDDYLTFCDESHLMLPQIRGMYNTNISRKTNLSEYGFRLPSSIDNRPLTFDEFYKKSQKIFCISATPGDFELEETKEPIIEQIVRPTGLIDPQIIVKSSKGQFDDLKDELNKIIKKKERAFITVLTKRMAESLSSTLLLNGYKVSYLHDELKTLERNEILTDLRRGIYDIVVGINLIREGIDTPEVSLVVIFDADKQGFLRNARSLIQTIGRAARNVNGKVIMYANKITDSMNEAIEETNRRREKQISYNKKYNIIPTTIVKPIKRKVSGETIETFIQKAKTRQKVLKRGKKIVIQELEKQMRSAARDHDFDRAIALQAYIEEIKAGF